jgi:hypothetical protein
MDLTDPTSQICTDLMKPFDKIPNHARDLVSLVDEPLLGTLPLRDFEFNMIKSQVCIFIIPFIIIYSL